MIERTVRIRASAGGAVALVIALIAGLPDGVRAADEFEKIQAEAGRQWYDEYCTPCHGAAGAPGSAMYPNTKKSVDLRDYVARNGGRFPAERWINVVTTDNPTLVHTDGGVGSGSPREAPSPRTSPGVPWWPRSPTTSARSRSEPYQVAAGALDPTDG